MENTLNSRKYVKMWKLHYVVETTLCIGNHVMQWKLAAVDTMLVETGSMETTLAANKYVFGKCVGGNQGHRNNVAIL